MTEQISTEHQPNFIQKLIKDIARSTGLGEPKIDFPAKIGPHQEANPNYLPPKQRATAPQKQNSKRD